MGGGAIPNPDYHHPQQIVTLVTQSIANNSITAHSRGGQFGHGSEYEAPGYVMHPGSVVDKALCQRWILDKVQEPDHHL